MNVCLISYPTATEFDLNLIHAAKKIKVISKRPSLGVLTLASVLEEAGHHVTHVDLNLLYLERELDSNRAFADLAAEHLSNIEADIYGFSSICSTYPLTIRITKLLRKYQKDSCIVLGGPQASLVDLQTLETFPWIDMIVRGEGEEALPKLLEVLNNVRSPNDVPNLTYRQDGRVHRSPLKSFVKDLDAIPMPAYHLYPIDEGAFDIPLEIGRGCPFSCKFCSTSEFFGRRYRLKSPQRVVKEVKTLSEKYSICSFGFSHDLFTVKRDMVIEICEALIAEAIPDLTWRCSARIDTIDDALIELMAKAGCVGMFFGIETGSPELQKEINKNLNLDQVVPKIKHASESGIKVTASFITGFPTETKENLSQTMNMMLDLACLDDTKPQITTLAPLPETALHKEFRDRLKLDDFFSGMSFQGQIFDQEDYDLIAKHPEIFPEFYGIPTAHLERAYLNELVKFLMVTTRKLRLLTLFLHQHAGGFLELFDKWIEWRKDKDIDINVFTEEGVNYYFTIDFPKHFFEFITCLYFGPGKPYPEVLQTLLNYEKAKYNYISDMAGVLDKQDQPDPDWLPTHQSVPKVKKDVHIEKLPANYESIGLKLKNKLPLDDITPHEVYVAYEMKENDEIDITQLPELASRLITLCDGKSSISEITQGFSEYMNKSGTDLNGVPADTICLAGLDSLHDQGLLVL